MEILDFVKVGSNSGSGYGYGSGSGYGSGDGYGDGSGDGDGYGDGSGDGDGDGYGYGSGSGYGSGYGYGDGSGYGSGYGYGYGSGYGSGCGYGDGSGCGSGCGDGYGCSIKSINGIQVHVIDGVQTAITVVKSESIANGYILRRDLTLKKCIIVKRNNLFAHGETLRKAMEALNDKLFEDMPIEERIDEFLKKFKADGTKYHAMKFFDWHNKLTGSCDMGRRSFATNHGIDIESDEFTVDEFIELTKSDYNGSILKELKKTIERRKNNE